MIEVLWHGRGGQGAFTAARLLGAAASMKEGCCALAFPAFGPERRGAPMRAYTKIANASIGDRSAIKKADYVVYLDDTLLGDGWDAELKPGGTVLVNSTEHFDDERIKALDADGISASILGRPIPNTVLLGALSKLCNQVEAEDVKEAIRQYMPEKLHAKNIAIIDTVREQLDAGEQGSVQEVGADEGTCAPLSDEVKTCILADEKGAACSRNVDSTLEKNESSTRPSASIPTLRSVTLDPDSFAHTTCFEAGHLVAKNAGWRNERPLINQDACTGCLQCYFYCPDGTIFKVEKAQTKTSVAIDYDFCKGCGICAKVCPVDAISLISEKDALANEAKGMREGVPRGALSERAALESMSAGGFESEAGA
ncbi:MAG: 2-oxoacid:acceptor oxidoreductase family protein [Gordonibacter sp.]|nr:2-oxoacid:acceptor oxidoreductase family protein [Gordonibacter sp.]